MYIQIMCIAHVEIGKEHSHTCTCTCIYTMLHVYTCKSSIIYWMIFLNHPNLGDFFN